MDERIDNADKKVLVDIVKLAQRRGMKGELGDWKEFLKSRDNKFGAHLSDPAKRSHEMLAAFLKTFSKDEDLKFFANIMRHHSNQFTVEKLKDKAYDSPEQRLVQATLQHPLYSLDYSFSSIDEGWIIINLRNKSKVMKFTAMVAVDCEMVLCEDGTEALVKVCVVDQNLEVKLHEFVKPKKEIIDYRTDITGVTSQDLETVTCSLADIQKSMKKLLSNGTILVGHSLHNDLSVLKIDHVRVVDTSYIFQYGDGSIHRKPSLNSLCQAVLGYEVRKQGAPHNCLDDARAAMKLVLAKIKHGVDQAFPITLVQGPVSESEMAKLLIHRIPTAVNNETLHKIVPGDFSIELKPSRKGKGELYSASAIFKNQQEAHNAYENVQGSQSKDSHGRPQKLVTFQLSTGKIVNLFVRKMAADGSCDPTPSKRALPLGEEVDVPKKAKIDTTIEEDASKCDAATHLKENEVLNQRLKDKDLEIESLRKMLSGSSKCDSDNHLNEIEALNQQLKEKDLEIESLKEQLRQKDFDISMLHKMVSSLKKKKTG